MKGEIIIIITFLEQFLLVLKKVYKKTLLFEGEIIITINFLEQLHLVQKKVYKENTTFENRDKHNNYFFFFKVQIWSQQISSFVRFSSVNILLYFKLFQRQLIRAYKQHLQLCWTIPKSLSHLVYMISYLLSFPR